MLENWGQRLSPTEIRASQMWTRVKVTSFRRLGQRGQVTGGNGHCLPPQPFPLSMQRPKQCQGSGETGRIIALSSSKANRRVARARTTVPRASQEGKGYRQDGAGLCL